MRDREGGRENESKHRQRNREQEWKKEIEMDR